MSLTNPPPVVSSLNTMLAATTTFPATYSTRVWYPSADVSGENTGSPATMPLAVIFHESARRTKYAVGAAGLAGGSLRLVLYRDTDVGTLETEAQAILSELLALDTGLALRDGDVGACSDPAPGARAADATINTEYRTITINLNYGLTA
jgi:hypothetical protein